jgi:hypothetical protein
MAKTADEVRTGGNLRFFYQLRGASPFNQIQYAGVDGQYITIEEVSNPKSGGISPINVHDPNNIKKYKRVGRQAEAPDFPTADVQFMQGHGGIPRQLYDLADCVTTFYQVAGRCQDLSVFSRGTYDYIKILSEGEVTDKTEGGTGFDADEGIIDSLPFTFGNIYPVGPLNFSNEGTTAVARAVVDVAYGSRIECGNCGTEDDGTQKIYALITNAAANPPVVVYSTNGGTTWATATITGSADTDIPKAIGVVSNKLVVLTNTATTSSLFIADINPLTGVPGAFTLVTTGFVTNNPAQDMVIENARAIWFAADNGYIYKSTNLLQGVTVSEAGNATANDLARIDARDGAIVAVGQSGTVVYSLNRGENWVATTNAAGASTLTSVSVVTATLWITGVGTTLYYTRNRGESAWNTAVVSSGTIADIVFPTTEVGYILAAETGVGVVYMTTNGGEQWERKALTGASTAARLAYPEVGNLAIATNNVFIGGIGVAPDGILLQGVATVIG